MTLKPLVTLIAAFLTLASATLAKDSEYSHETNPNVISTEEKLALLESHDQAFLALNERVRDPFVHKGPDGYYYLTGTTAGSHWGPTIGIKLWRSKNLAEWEDMGFVWDLYKDGGPQRSWHFFQRLKNTDFLNPRAIWAPEIHYMNGTWWIPHCMNIGGHGLLRSTTGKPEGPYEVMPMISDKLIDAHLYEEDGDYYYLWQADIIAKMDDRMKKLVEEPVRLEHDGNHPMGYEGVLMLKLEDKYVFVASGRYGYETTNTYDLFYAVSENLKGPYGKRRKAIKNAGHGNLFQDDKGRWWATAFDHEFIDPKNPHRWNFWLVPVDIEVTEDDVLFHVKDERFQPKQQDHDEVKQLAIDGVPPEWEGKAPWWRPGK